MASYRVFKNFDLQLTVPIEQIRNRAAQPLMQRLLRLKGTPRLTDRTLVSKSAVIEEIDKVRQRGWALDNQENEFDGRCIGSAIVGSDGRVIAALSVSGPVFRMDMARSRALVPELQGICGEISGAVRG